MLEIEMAIKLIREVKGQIATDVAKLLDNTGTARDWNDAIEQALLVIES